MLDADGHRIGYVLRTSPISDAIRGYVGPTDTLVTMNSEGKVIGIKIRRSDDTKSHVEDVTNDTHFTTTWNGMTWEQVAGMDLKKAGVEGTSGATLTSMAVAESIVHRFKKSSDDSTSLPSMRVRMRDVGTTLVVVAALLMAFTKLRGKPEMRRMFQVVVIGYLGFINGDLLAQSLLAGWSVNGVAWRLAPGLTLLVGAALVVPVMTRRQVYCTHLCPHGAAQEMLGRIWPWKIHLRTDVARGLKWLPTGLLALVVVVVMLNLPLDLADIEAFDAYLIRSAGMATIVVAVVGLIASLFVPMAYCKYGCPTGEFLEFVRSHGRADRFGARDIVAGLLLVLVVFLRWKYQSLTPFLS